MEIALAVTLIAAGLLGLLAPKRMTRLHDIRVRFGCIGLVVLGSTILMWADIAAALVIATACALQIGAVAWAFHALRSAFTRKRAGGSRKDL